jgi:glycosyltransferase involved in cell wall biosynthesis
MSFKVCHLTSVHSVDDVRIFVKECTSLAANGFDVTLIVCADTSFEDIKNGVTRISLGVPVKNRIHRMIKRTKCIYKKALEVNADIYHFHDPELLPIGLKLRNLGKKVIFDSHEFYGEQIREKRYISKIIRNMIASIYMKYEAYVCKKIDAVVQVCTLEGKNYFNGRAAKTINIINAPILKEFIPSENIPFEERECIACIGGLTHERGITNLVRAASKAKNKLILCGNYASKDYQKELFALPEFSTVDYRGFIDTYKINEVLNECFAGVSTLLHIGQYPKIDTLPTKVYEYMSMGLPVIISNTPFAKKMIDKYKFGICVDPSSVEEIVDAIVYLDKNKLVGKKMGENGQKAVLNEFNWMNEEKKLLILYNNLF